MVVPTESKVCVDVLDKVDPRSEQFPCGSTARPLNTEFFSSGSEVKVKDFESISSVILVGIVKKV